MKKILTKIVVMLLIINNINAQNKINTTVDTNIIDFAEQTTFRITIQTNNTTNNIKFPNLKDTLTKNIEIIKIYPIDTIKNSPLTLEKAIIITSFEDSMQTIPAIPIIINNDTIFTAPLQIFVKPLHIDSTELAKLDTNQTIPIFNNFSIFEKPLTFAEFWLRYAKHIIIAIIIITLLLIGIPIYKKFKHKKPIKILKKPLDPAHIIALRELKKLKQLKLSEKGKIKEYYSKLSEILKKYIEQRFYIKTLERTSTEILNDFEISKILKEKLLINLQKLLNIADLAKFAKYKPSQNSNIENYNLTEDFVNQTKIEPKPEKENNTTNINKQKNN